MSLIERAEKVLAEIESGHLTHNLHLELVALVRAFHHEASSPVLPDSAAPISIQVPAKAPEPSKSESA